jgi:hypothetical protein
MICESSCANVNRCLALGIPDLDMISPFADDPAGIELPFLNDWICTVAGRPEGT